MQLDIGHPKTSSPEAAQPDRATVVATYFLQECPVCSRKLQIRVEHLRDQVACQHCHSQFVATDPAFAPCDGDSNLEKADQLLALCSGNNAALRDRIVRYLRMLEIDGLENIQVGVDCGVVVLRGRIASPYDRWLCRNSAERVAGVLRVIDELEIGNGVPTRKFRAR